MTAAAAIEIGPAGGGDPERRAEVLDRLDRIIDPCSSSIGRPVGLVGMGMIERLDIVGSAVAIEVLPTFPTCLFRGVFEEEIPTRLKALAWCTDVTVTFSPADRSWDESRLSREARRLLGRKSRSPNRPPVPASR